MHFFATSADELGRMQDDYKAFVIEYRDAADRLLSAQGLGVEIDRRSGFGFPRGSFPPAFQFVGGSLLPPPPPPPSQRLEYADQG